MVLNGFILTVKNKIIPLQWQLSASLLLFSPKWVYKKCYNVAQRNFQFVTQFNIWCVDLLIHKTSVSRQAIIYYMGTKQVY